MVSDPSDLQAIDEIGLQLGMPVRVTVGAPSEIQSILKKSESSTRVLEEATEGFQMQILRDEEEAATRISPSTNSPRTSARSSGWSTRWCLPRYNAGRRTSTSKRRTTRCM